MIKKSILMFATLGCLSIVQVVYGQSRDITLNIELKDVISGGGTGDGGTATGSNQVDFDFSGEANYRETQSKVVLDQLRVLSTKNYDINVKAQTANFTSSTSSSTLPLSIIKISTALNGTTTFGTAVTPTTADQVIYTGGVPTLGQGFDFKYEISPNILLVQAPKEKYNVVLTYTVVAK